MNAISGVSTRRMRALVGVALVAFAASLAPARAAEPTTLTAAIIGISVSIWPAIVADKKGFFREEGLDVDFINSGASTRSLRSEERRVGKECA